MVSCLLWENVAHAHGDWLTRRKDKVQKRPQVIPGHHGKAGRQMNVLTSLAYLEVNSTQIAAS
jgi:hypothetical protein